MARKGSSKKVLWIVSAVAMVVFAIIAFFIRKPKEIGLGEDQHG